MKNKKNWRKFKKSNKKFKKNRKKKINKKKKNKIKYNKVIYTLQAIPKKYFKITLHFIWFLERDVLL